MKTQCRNISKKRAFQSVIILAVLLAFVLAGCSPYLTPEDRKKDIQYLAKWAKDYSPFVELNEKHKGCQSYEALKPKYVELAEQAQSNEEFLQVVYGYFSLIGDSGHAYLIPVEYLAGYIWQFLLVNPTEISWGQFHEAAYWPRLFQNTCLALPPFPVVRKEHEYFTGGAWRYKTVTIPQGSKILKVNGMTCSSYLDATKKNTWLRYVAGDVDWLDERLLAVNEGKKFRGWQVDFLLPDSTTVSTFVPGKKWNHEAGKTDFTDWSKGNCICVELNDDTAYVRIKSCIDKFRKRDRRKIKMFLEHAQGKYSKLIIDIRDNPGGSHKYIDHNLIRPLIGEPIRYKQITGVRRKFVEKTKQSYLNLVRCRCWIVNVEETDPPEGFSSDEWIFYENTREFGPSGSYNFKGDVDVLINAGVGSAADDYANIVKRTGIARLVGQNTGGGAAAYYAPVMARLPESGMIFMLEADLLINPDGSYDEISGTAPHIKLPPADLPESLTKEELLKDEWIKKIMTEL